MIISIIGTGNVGGALATHWSKAGHTINLGVRDAENFKGLDLLKNPGTSLHSIEEAVRLSDVILMATPATAAIEATRQLGDTSGKLIIDAMNIVGGRGPQGYTNTAEAILDNTNTDEVVKCFNTTGFNNMKDPNYNGMAVDLFCCGNSKRGKEIAVQLAKDAGFAECYDVGGNDKFELMEQFAWFWINLAMVQGQGREIAFKLLRR